MHPGNHISVWGSYWKEGEWGYICCHQTVKNSYCTGQAGREAAENALASEQRNLEAKAVAAPGTTAAALQVSKLKDGSMIAGKILGTFGALSNAPNVWRRHASSFGAVKSISRWSAV